MLSSCRTKLRNFPIRLTVNTLNNSLNQKRNVHTDLVSSFVDSIHLTSGQLAGGTGGLAAMSAAVFFAMRYKVAKPNQYLARTGLFLGDDIVISKQSLQLPFQSLTVVNLEPTTYKCIVDEAMSQERISFNMPTFFTIGPKDDIESVKKFAKLLNSCSPDDLKAKVIGIIQGEARVAAGKIALDDLFNNREEFKMKLVNEVDRELRQFGLTVYNANIEELKDMVGNEYFSSIRKKALEGAVNKAKVEVAEQNKFGTVGESMHTTETRQKVAEYEKNAKITENDRDKEIAESASSLAIAKADMQRRVAIAENEAKANSEKRQLELQQEVEQFRSKQEIERLRASEFTVANVKAEVCVRTAEGEADAIRIKAEGEANATRLKAEALAFSRRVQAEALFFEKENEAKGIIKLREAEAEGLNKLIASAGGAENLNSYLMVRDGQLTQIAREQSEAVRGMKPNVTVWNSGSTNDSTLSTLVNDLVKTGVPMVQGLQQTTGIDLLKGFRK